MITPLLVKEIRKNGKVIEAFENRVLKSNLCDAGTLKGIRECLHDVVWDEIHPLITLKEEQLTDLSFLQEGGDSMVSGESFQEIFGQLKEKMSKK